MIYSINFILNSLLKKQFSQKNIYLFIVRELNTAWDITPIVIVREIMHFKHAKNSFQMLNSFEKNKKNMIFKMYND